MSILEKDPFVELAKSVICTALLDAVNTRDCLDRREGRAFLLASSPGWKSSLHDWCLVANVSPDRITKKTREWEEKGWPTDKEIRGLIAQFYKQSQ